MKKKQLAWTTDGSNCFEVLSCLLDLPKLSVEGHAPEIRTTCQHLMACCVVFILAWWVLTPTAMGAEPSFISGMPSVSQVLQKVRAKDRFDTTARQVGVFDQLTNIMEVFEGPLQVYHGRPTSGEARLRHSYMVAQNRIMAALSRDHWVFSPSPTGAKRTYTQWVKERWAYSDNTHYALHTLFSPQMQRDYAEAVNASMPKKTEEANKNTARPPPNSSPSNNIFKSVSIGLVGIILFILFIVGVIRIVSGGASSSKKSGSFSRTQTNTQSSNSYGSNQRTTCTRCGGTGETNCHAGDCRSGYRFTGGSTEFCATCGGRGKVTCSSCNGSGYQ